MSAFKQLNDYINKYESECSVRNTRQDRNIFLQQSCEKNTLSKDDKKGEKFDLSLCMSRLKQAQSLRSYQLRKVLASLENEFTVDDCTAFDSSRDSNITDDWYDSQEIQDQQSSYEISSVKENLSHMSILKGNNSSDIQSLPTSVYLQPLNQKRKELQRNKFHLATHPHMNSKHLNKAVELDVLLGLEGVNDRTCTGTILQDTLPPRHTPQIQFEQPIPPPPPSVSHSFCIGELHSDSSTSYREAQTENVSVDRAGDKSRTNTDITAIADFDVFWRERIRTTQSLLEEMDLVQLSQWDGNMSTLVTGGYPEASHSPQATEKEPLTPPMSPDFPTTPAAPNTVNRYF